jgi:hypothetical protein
VGVLDFTGVYSEHHAESLQTHPRPPVKPWVLPQYTWREEIRDLDDTTCEEKGLSKSIFKFTGKELSFLLIPIEQLVRRT